MEGSIGRVAGKVAFVTGAASGIGLAIARCLASEGASVVLADIDAEAGRRQCDRLSSAGLPVRFEPLDVTSEEEWRRTLAVNLDGVYLGVRHGGAAIVASGGGSIVNISSVASRAATVRGAAYCASKAGVAQLTKVAALEWAHLGVRVNSVHPGYVETPLVEELMSRAPDSEAMHAAAVARQPIGRLGSPDEIAKAVLYLSSDEASFTTGAELVVDGGYML